MNRKISWRRVALGLWLALFPLLVVMAVTESGGHIMAYLGDQRWTEADPLDLKVLVFTVPEPRNAWFALP